MPLFSPETPTPFSFHCTICFEPFDHDERTPVILPCGHTFLCAICSKRLKRCMECRTSLFLNVHPPVPKLPQNERFGTARTSGAGRLSSPVRRASPNAVPPPALPPPGREPVALPLPKNLLLLSLMETAEREARAKKAKALKVAKKEKNEKKFTSSPSSTEVMVNMKEGENDEINIVDKYSSFEGELHESSSLEGEEIGELSDDDFDDDDHRVRTSIAAISSACGTYAVADRAGLLVLPRKPKDAAGKSHNYTSSLNRRLKSDSLSPDLPLATPAPGGNDSNASPPMEQPSEQKNEVARDHIAKPRFIRNYSDPPLPYELEYGARVQVVTIEDGWVQLARNMGFLFVEHKQLVKVGGPADKACEIEAMLINVDETREELHAKQEELNRVETGLEQELEKALLQPPVPDKPHYELDAEEEKENDVPLTQPNGTKKPAAITMSPEQKQQDQELLRTPSPPPDNISPLGASAQASADAHQHQNLRLPRLSPSLNLPNSSHSSLPTSAPLSPPRMLVRQHSDPRRLNSPQQSSSQRHSTMSPTDSRIDFRTGLSGHCALLSNRTHASHPASSNIARRMMMSGHRGIGGLMGSSRNLSRSGNRTSGRDSSGLSLSCTNPDSVIATLDDNY